MIAEAELQQEARRVLRRLAAPRQVLFAKDPSRQGGDFAIGRGAASRVAVTAPLVAAFARQGWIVPDGAGRYVIGPAGRDFLARDSGGFAAQHREMRAQALDGAAVTVNVGESPLARLKARGLVDGVQFAAGEKLRRDFTLAQLTPRLGVNWEAPVVSGGRGAGQDSISDIALAARQRFNQALAAMGPGLADLLFDVCCHLTVLERCEDARGWSRRSGRVVLLLALDRLAAHYGMTVVRRHARIRAWSQEAPA
jgi:hypothetical protein